MRIPVTFDRPLGMLLDELQSPGIRRRVISTLVSSFLCEDSNSYKDAIMTATSSETKSILNDVKDVLCWKTIANDPDATRIDLTTMNLAEVLDTEQIITSIHSNSEPLRVGDRRNDAFQRKFVPLLRRAKRVEVIDPYASTNLMQKTAGTTWFVKNVLENFNGVFSIYTQEPRDGNNAPAGVRAKRELLEKNLRALIAPLHDFVGDVRVNLVDAEFVKHNRRFGLKFDSGQATIILEKGLDTFDSDPFSESQELANADFAEFKRAISAANSSRNKHEIVINHKQSCTACSEI